MNEKIPAWLRKPAHRKEVVATDKGWAVKDTGELLVRVRDLSAKIAAYFGSDIASVSTVPVVETKQTTEEVETVTKADIDTAMTTELVTKPTETETVASTVVEPAPIVAPVAPTAAPEAESKKAWMNNGTERKLVDPEDVDALLEQGWVKGRGKNK
jgi:hypothetical protein